MSIHLRIKICGITTAEDARQAALLGADAIGLNFHPESPRRIEPPVAYGIIRTLPPFLEPVGVFTDSQSLGKLASTLGLKYLQWHGEVDQLPSLTVGAMAVYRLIVAFRVHDQKSLSEVERWLRTAKENRALPAAILIDGYVPGQYGGTGQTAPWQLIADFKPEVPLILAGGLTPENVAEAVRIVRPYAVDVASGVESSPGRKDVKKMKRFIDNARSAAG